MAKMVRSLGKRKVGSIRFFATIRGKVGTTLFRKNHKSHFIIVHIYIDDIISRATNEYLFMDILKLMQDEFEMSMIGELKFFLEFQIKQTDEGIFIHQSKYAKELLKKLKLKDYKCMCIPMHSTSVLTLDDNDKKVDQTAYRGLLVFVMLTKLKIDSKGKALVEDATSLEQTWSLSQAKDKTPLLKKVKEMREVYRITYERIEDEFSKAQNNLQILDSLQKNWEPKSTTIQKGS
ncbi:putative mitochondrial protein, partial [Mucuna pruriens]